MAGAETQMVSLWSVNDSATKELMVTYYANLLGQLRGGASWVLLCEFLELSSYPILADKRKVSAPEAKLKAEGEYEIYSTR